MSAAIKNGGFWFAIVVICLMGAVGSLVIAHDYPAPTARHTVTQTPPDWTYAPCSDWAGTSTPTLPPYTFTEACVAPDGSILTPSK